jgi:hypothetical protein
MMGVQKSLVIERDTSGSWSQVAKFVAADAAATDYFGLSVAISGTIAIVGARLNDDGGMSCTAV